MVIWEHGATKTKSEEDNDDEEMPPLEDCSDDGIKIPTNEEATCNLKKMMLSSEETIFFTLNVMSKIRYVV